MINHSTPRLPLIRTLACVAALALAVGTAQAQQRGNPGAMSVQGAPGTGPTAGSRANSAGGPRPPRVGGVDAAKTIQHFAVGIGVMALCVGVVVIPGRRDHDE